MPLEAGTQLGPYEILSPIGAGGMGEVYRARDMKLERPTLACRLSLTFNRLGARLIGMALSAALVTACASGAYKQGELAARTGDWDAAVEYYRRALQEDSRRPDFRIALERAKLNASWVHLAAARDLEARDELAAALAEYQKASGYDPSNSHTTDRLAAIEREIPDRLEASLPRLPVEAPAGLETQPPLLDPSSREPLRIRFTDASLRNIPDFIGDATGINVIYDQQFQDRSYSVQLDSVTIEEALELILTANQYFYKVLNPRSIVIAPETPDP